VRPRKSFTRHDVRRYAGPGISLGVRNVVRIIVVLTLGFWGGCNIPNTPLTGAWLFNLATSGSDVILATANLTQHGSNVTGQVTLSGSGVSCGGANYDGDWNHTRQ